MRKIKKIISILLIAAIMIPLIPIGEIRAFANTGINIPSLTINYSYKNRNVKLLDKITFYMSLTFQTEGDYVIKVIDNYGKEHTIGNIRVDERNVGKPISPSNLELIPKDNIRIDGLIIGGTIIDLETSLPQILTMQSNDVILGTKLEFVGDDLYEGTLRIDGIGTTSPISNTQFSQQIDTGSPGYKNIKFTKTNSILEIPKITQNITYPEAFKLLGSLSELGDNLEIMPKEGENESIAYIRTDGKFNVKDGVGQYSVFFLKDDTDKYSEANMAEIISFSQDGKIMKIRVPKKRIDEDKGKNIKAVPGIEDSTSYIVQLTNRIENPKGNIDEQVLERKNIVPGRYFVQGAGKFPKITSISPNKGPDMGEVVEVWGHKFDEIDFIEGFGKADGVKWNKVTTGEKILSNNLGDILGTEGANTDGEPDNVFHIEYDINEGETTYNREKVERIDRYIAVYIGNKTKPNEIDNKPVYTFDDEGFDIISVEVPNTPVDSERQVNVIMIMQTEIKTEDGKTHIIVNLINNDKRYTITPSHTRPTVTKVSPELVQVVGRDNGYGLKEDMIISIEGENFKVLRSTDNTGKSVTNYPTVGIGATMSSVGDGPVIRVSPNNEGQVEIRRANSWEIIPGASIMVLDAEGNIIDGTVGKDTGSKIVIGLPKNADLRIPANSVTTDRSSVNPRLVYVMNPILRSSSPGEAVSNENVTVTFIDLKDGAPPTIDEVNPNVVAIDSGEEIIVTGRNFKQGIRVFVGGTEVTGIKLELDPSGVGNYIKFNAPKFPQIIDGPTKIMVMNPDGGIAVRDFIYVKSMENDPTLTNFSPKSGTIDTVVVVDGDNFLPPSPEVVSTAGMGIYRLIGSRILMDGKDINEYNTENGNIVLKEYTNSVEHLVYPENGLAKLADYAHSIILEDKNNPNKFYTIYTNNRGEIFLSDGGSSTEEENTVNSYSIRVENNEIIGEKGGKKYDIVTNEKGLSIKNNGETIDLIMKTPYKFNENTKEIYGSRVRVIDKNRIEFRVPSLVSKQPGGYTITVENPDTKKTTAKDLFNFIESVTRKPEITRINPSIGAREGGYQILIEGKYFEDTSKVYVDGVQVPPANVKKETTGGRDILIITSMPAYRRDMDEEKISRKLVPITVENGDGGTALGRFTYVIPPSVNPVIESVEFQKEVQIGSAAGEEVLTIIGNYFKFEEPWALTPKYQGWKEGVRDGQTIFYEDLDGNDEYTSYTNWRDYEGEREGLISQVETYTEYLSSPILPKVRIGGIEAKIVEFGDGYIKVITPKISAGRHELYVMNNDFGTSNKVNLTFEGSKITISKIVGNTGKKQGQDSVEITGTGFQNTRFHIFEGNQKRERNMPLVRFGKIGGTKDINNNRTQIVLENGDFIVDFNNTELTSAEIKLTAKFDKEIYTKTFKINAYDGSPIYLPIWELENNGVRYPGYELIKVERIGRKLVVEKGYSPETKLVNSNQISLKTPSYYTIGDVDVEVTNPDGGKATTKYKYTNPASKPRIIDIERDGRKPEEEVGDGRKTRVIVLDYRGGQNITVLGEDFREGATIQIGSILDIANKDIRESLNTDPHKLSFVMPGVNESILGSGGRSPLYRVTVTNGDGAQTSSDNTNNEWGVPIYIQFIKGESAPEAGNIEPNRGPATGGTIVTIKGKDFRDNGDKNLSIFFGEVEVPFVDILEITDTTIRVRVPASPNLGPVRVRIENPDGTLTQDNLTFTYISKPKIDDVNPKKLFTNDTETVVTLTGSQFLPGATVIVGGQIIPTKDVKDGMDIKGQGITGVDSSGNNINSTVIGGVAATVQSVTDGEIKLTFPGAVDLENSSIIVINPDGGISDPYNDFKYELPLPLKPMVLEGIPGYEQTVMLIWNKSDPNLLNRATGYEIYGRKTSDTANIFVGTTEGAEYLIKGLEPNTEYIFMVRALNEHGAAIDFAEVKVRTLSTQEDYKQKEKEEQLKEEQKNLADKGKEVIEGNKVIKTLGREDIKNGLGNIDFTLAKYKNATEYIINIPLALARTDSTLNIKDGTINMSINPKDMYTYKVSTMDTGDKDSNLQIIIKKGRETNIPRGKKVASNAYEIDFKFQRGKDIVNIDKLLRTAKVTLNLDNLLYSAAKNPVLTKYNISKGQYENTNSTIATIDSKGKYILLSDR